MLKKLNSDFGWRPAATSCVWPETAAENCRRLARTVPEVGVYLLELQACLNYGPEDLPRKPRGLVYHAHLPLDLPWRLGGETVFAAMERLFEKIAALAPWAFVLHPPEEAAALKAYVAAFAASGRDPKALLLENTEETSPEEVLSLARRTGCGMCLDLGHMLAMGHPLPGDVPALVQTVRMLHVYSPFEAGGPPPGKRHCHRPLTRLAPEGRETLLWMLRHLRPETIVAEVFAPTHLLESLAVLDVLAELAAGGEAGV